MATLFIVSIAINGGLYLGTVLFSAYKISAERNLMAYPKNYQTQS